MKKIILQQEGDKTKAKEAKKYIIQDNPNVLHSQIDCSASEFIMTYAPCFGKYEIEKFIGDKMMVAIFETKDITQLFNQDIFCDDFPFETMRITADEIKERVLKCFEVANEDEHNVYLMFKWEPYENII